MHPWTYQNKVINSIDDIPDATKVMGFIYLMTNINSGKKYIGRKILWSTRTKTVAGKKKKSKVESDWKDYCSSSPIILKEIEDAGHANHFTREILAYVSSKGMLAAGEEFALYASGALEQDCYYNNNIRSKIYRTWVKQQEMQSIRDSLKAKMLYL
jgi:hypothetical protein